MTRATDEGGARMAACVERSIGFFAPSGYLPDPTVLDRATQHLAGRGWRVVRGEGVLERQQRFAGPDSLRLAELQRFATDRALDVAVAARGGYGLSRLLDRIDFDAIRSAAPILVGYSDFTAFNLGYLARAGGISFQGPAASDFGDGDERAYTMTHFFNAVAQPRCEVEFESDGPNLAVEGRLWGGNLSLLCAMLGTPYMPDVRGGILFVEDVNEAAYRVERMLLQLWHAGVLQRQRALVLGEFAPMPALPNDDGYGLAAAIDCLRERLPATPIIAGLPFGHGRRRATLPVGADGCLRVRDGRAQLAFEGHPVLRAR